MGQPEDMIRLLGPRLGLPYRTLSLPPNHTVVREGDESDDLYVMLSGRAEVYRCDDQGREVALATLEEGSYFGEQALLDSGPRSATIATLTPCELFVLDRNAFKALILQSGSEVVYRILADLSRRVRETTTRFFKDELAQQALRAEMEIERHRALSHMVAGVAHEVNTPLGIASTAVSVINRQLASPTLAGLAQDAGGKRALDAMLEAADLLARNIQRAHKLVQDFKKISISQLTDTNEKVNLSEVVAETVALFKITARRARLEVEISDTLTDGSRTWRGYRGYLSQVLLNLLTNVERYAYPGGAGGEVAITVAAESDRHVPTFTLVVRDFGQGIAPEHLPQVFDPFFTTGRALGGTGLGLAIVHNIVTGPLQGTVAIRSEPGQGTAVTLTFPQTITG